MVQYATESELAGFLQRDVDTYSASQALTLASGEFSAACGVWFAAQTVTWTTEICADTRVFLPFRDVTAVSAVRVNGVTVTGWTLINGVLYQPVGFGSLGVFPPDVLAVDLTYGRTSVPDDAKKAVLQMAGQRYEAPLANVSMEQIDDFLVRYDGKPVIANEDPAVVIARYRGFVFA